MAREIVGHAVLLVAVFLTRSRQSKQTTSKDKQCHITDSFIIIIV